jgi:hypothetical protein
VQALSPAGIAQQLGLDDSLRPWLTRLAGLADVPPLAPLVPAEAVAKLRKLGVADAVAAEMVAGMAAWSQDAGLWWLVERCHHDLTRRLGDSNAAPFEWHALPRGGPGELFWPYVFLAAVEDVHRWHAARGIPDDVSWATLSVLGSQLNQYRHEHGRAGLDVTLFFSLAFQGVLYHLGRLSYIPYSLCTHPEAGPLFWYGRTEADAGDPALSIHVPEGAPLDEAACDSSLHRACELFAEHFLTGAARVGTCTSWLLDPQLAEYVPAESNIVKFQRRFQLVPGVKVDNDSILAFLRGGTPAASDRRRETALHRAAKEHIRAGKSWHMRTGWIDLRG